MPESRKFTYYLSFEAKKSMNGKNQSTDYSY